MKWMLVVVGVFNGGPEVTMEGVYNDMFECFAGREEIIYDYFGNAQGQPPANFQVICIPTDKY